MYILKEGSTGPLVELLQSTLKKLGFFKFEIDGNFGTQTKNAVINFQKAYNLNPDGIVGNNTWNSLMPYINGYSLYTVKSGDTFYSIALKYGTSVNSIIFANPKLNYNNLQIGENIIVPFGNIVPTDISYTSYILSLNINSLKAIYPFLEIFTIGTSVLGNSIPAIKFGNGKKEVLYVASTHANEWITTPLLMKFLETLSKAYVNNLKVFNTSARKLFDNCSLYIVPMLNPDGVDLLTGNLNQNSSVYQNVLRISNSFPDLKFPNDWKANIQGVDLNLQFPAGWENAKEIKYSQGYNRPAPRDFVGYGPLTEPESLALYNFTLSHNFSLMLTYHSQGEVIYWQYQNYRKLGSIKYCQ